MSKFKEGDYVILREDARYPGDGSLWSTIDKSLKCGDLFKVKQTGEYKWSRTDKLDCVSVFVFDNSGWIPESCFDHANISKFKKDELVECYRLPNEYDWTITKCGEINHNLTVGAQYNVIDFANNGNIKINHVSGWFPPTIFRKVKQLPKQWCVACKNKDTDTPELLEWRDSGWVGEGYISYNKIWYTESSDLQVISYETFLKLVYIPWKSIQPIVKNPPPSDIIKCNPYTETEPITNLSSYSKELPSDSTKQYSYPVVTEPTTTKSSSFPKLIINKTKKRLLSTKVQEFNVNLNLLKTP
jgi:hypothetical protein